MSQPRSILVTGGNAGIGLALCRQLAVDHGAHVFMGARDAQRGAQGLGAITIAYPEAAGRVELIALDVGSDASVRAAAAALRARGVVLSAIVNNAGLGGTAEMANVNFYGPKRVVDAFLPLLDADAGRVVNVSSGSAPMWLREQSERRQALYTSADTTWAELEAAVTCRGAATARPRRGSLPTRCSWRGATRTSWSRR